MNKQHYCKKNCEGDRRKKHLDNSATYFKLSSTLTESNYDSSMTSKPLPEGDLGFLVENTGFNRVLIIQWRDLEDHDSGGSELHSHKIAEIWAAHGIEVCFRTSAVKHADEKINRDGYTSVRSSGRFAVFATAAFDLISGRLGKFDAVVEVWNGMPFMTPLLTRGPNMVFLHHQHGPLWELALPKPFAMTGRFIERKVAPFFYRETPVVTLSDSSREEISSVLGLNSKKIHVVEPGIDESFQFSNSKSQDPLVVVAGRLSPYKQIENVISTLEKVRTTIPNVKLEIIGDGPHEKNIRNFVTSLKDHSWISINGRLSEEDLINAYQRAWVATSSSSSEGWGMTLTEAARCGTASVASNIPGHMNSVSHGTSGFLFDNNDEYLSFLIPLLSSRETAINVGEAAYNWSSQFTWKKTATESFRVLASTKQS